jgi:hypothetical protein
VAVKCGAAERIVRTDVLDRDMFEASANTPGNTAWTMRVLERVDKSLGPGVWDKPAFPSLNAEPPNPPPADDNTLHLLASGGYDYLFPNTSDKPSELYRASQIMPPQPTVRLVESLPYSPDQFTAPGYPPIAKAARLEGDVVFSFEPGVDGHPAGMVFEHGNPFLIPSVQDAAAKWVFPHESIGQPIRATIEFKLNCAVQPKPD